MYNDLRQPPDTGLRRQPRPASASHKSLRHRIRPARHPRQRHRARVYRHRADGGARADETHYRRVVERTPIGRWGEPVDPGWGRVVPGVTGSGVRDGARCRWTADTRHVVNGLAACAQRPHVAIPRETDHFHLAGGSRARPFGDAPRAGVLRKNGRDRVRQPQNVARVVANATRRFGRETLAPDGGVERVAELTLECQRDASGRLFAPEPSSANPCSGAADSTTRSIKPQRPISAPSSLRTTAR